MRFVKSGGTTDDHDEWKADNYLCVQVLQVYYDESETALKYLDDVGDDTIPTYMKIALKKRWEQIKSLIRLAFENGINPQIQANNCKIFDEL